MLFCWIFAGCKSEEERTVIQLLDLAQPLLQTDPEGAYAYLDSIQYSHILDDNSNVRWCMMICPLADSLQKPLPYVDDLDRASFYLEKYGEVEEQALINYYYARSLMEEGLSKPALNYYQDALEKTLRKNNYCFAGTISSHVGKIYHDQADYALSKDRYLEAVSYFEKAGDQKEWGIALKDVAREYAFIDSFDIALDYMLRADSVIQLVGDSADISTIYNGIGNVYLMQGDHSSAKPYFYKAINFSPDNCAPSLFALGSLYFDIDSLEKAEYFLNEAKQPTDNPDTHTEMFYYYAMLEAKRGNKDSVISYLMQYIDSSEVDIVRMKQTNLAKVETLFDRRQMVKEKLKLVRDKNRFQRIAVITCAFLLLVIIFYQQKVNYKNRKIISQVKELFQLKDDLQKKDDELTAFSEKLDLQRNVFLRNSAIYNKVWKLAGSMPKNNEPLLSEKDWLAIYKLIDQICPKLSGCLVISGISEKEKRYCYLSFFQLSSKQEEILLGVSSGTPDRNHTRIRQKLKDMQPRGSLYDYFMRL